MLMVNPGTYDLCTLAITTALTNSAQTPIVDLDGMAAANLLFELIGGTGGGTISALVQTSFDDGNTWLDISLKTYTNTAVKTRCVLENNAAAAMVDYAALVATGVNNGLLGDRLRAVITSTGTYTNTNLSIRASVH
jgi:hypothetical protein